MADPRNPLLGTSLNEEIQDRIIRHLIGLTRLSNSEAREILRAIDEDLIPDIMSQITGSIERMRARGILEGSTGTISPQQVQRLNTLRTGLQKISESWSRGYQTDFIGRLKDLGMREAQFQSGMIQNILPVELEFTLPAPSKIAEIIRIQPFDGRPLNEWFDSLSGSTTDRIMRGIRNGMVQGESIDQISRRIRGRRANNYADGILQTTRNNAQAIARSAVMQVSNQSADALYEANSDVIKAVQWTATLDSRTCAQCMGLDGRTWNVGEAPPAPAHISCRCIKAPVLRSWKELGIDLDEAPAGTRASMDGQVPDSLTYNDWLKRQANAGRTGVIEDALGKTRAKLFIKGELKVSDFTNREGDLLTLKQLMRKERDAFERAGVSMG